MAPLAGGAGGGPQGTAAVRDRRAGGPALENGGFASHAVYGMIMRSKIIPGPPDLDGHDVMVDDRGKELLDQAFDQLEQQTPDRVTKAIRWLRTPESRWQRLALGMLLILGSFFWFLPVVGIEWLPIGLMLIAQDVPILRRPAARLMLWLENRWMALRKRGERSHRRDPDNGQQ
jgi:hypothetical protein